MSKYYEKKIIVQKKIRIKVEKKRALWKYRSQRIRSQRMGPVGKEQASWKERRLWSGWGITE